MHWIHVCKMQSLFPKTEIPHITIMSQMQPLSASISPVIDEPNTFFLHVPEMKLSETSGRRSRKLQNIVVADNKNLIHPRMLEVFNIRSRFFSEKFTGSRLQAELYSCAQCMLFHYGKCRAT